MYKSATYWASLQHPTCTAEECWVVEEDSTSPWGPPPAAVQWSEDTLRGSFFDQNFTTDRDEVTLAEKTKFRPYSHSLSFKNPSSLKADLADWVSECLRPLVWFGSLCVLLRKSCANSDTTLFGSRPRMEVFLAIDQDGNGMLTRPLGPRLWNAFGLAVVGTDHETLESNGKHISKQGKQVTHSDT